MTYRAYIENDGVRTVLRDRHHAIASAKISEAKNAIGSFSFTIYPNHPAYGLLFPFTTEVKVVDMRDSSLAFDGRVLVADPAMDSAGLVCKQVTCESVMGYLRDSVQPFMAERLWGPASGKSGLRRFMEAVISNHNAMVEPRKHIRLGEVSVATYGTDSVYKGLQREDTFDTLEKKLIEPFGGEMALRRDGDGLVLDYKPRLGSERGTVIELGRNMKDASRSFSFGDVVTRLVPLGAKKENSNDRITVASVNGGREYIDDAELIAAYGIICGTREWDDVTVPSNLLSRGREHLASLRRVPELVSVTALDLSLIGIDPDAIRLHDWYRCRNRLIGLDAVLEVVATGIDLDSPHSSTYDFGEVSKLQSREVTAARKEASAAAAKAAGTGSASSISISWLENKWGGDN